MRNNHRYPIFLDLRGQPCLVVGGGSVAQRKVAALAKAGATVVVVSPEVNRTLAAGARRGGVTWKKSAYSSAHLRGMRLVIAATNDAGVNHRVFKDAERRGILVNVVDDLERCRFIVPARSTQGSLEIAVTTGGAAPALAAVVRDEIAETIGTRFAATIDALGKRRKTIKKLDADAKKRFWKKICGQATGGGLSACRVDDELAAAKGRNR